MKFSTETLEQVTQIIVTDVEQQLSSEQEISFTELEQGMREMLQAVGRESLGQMLSQEDKFEQGVKHPCGCQGEASRVSSRTVTLLSVFGWLEYRRSNYHCDQCGKRSVPLDEKHGLRPGQASQTMAKLLALAGVTVSFEEARQQITEYLLVDVSVNTIRKETQTIGERQRQQEAQSIEISKDIVYLQERERLCERPQQVYGSIDGAFVPVEHEWKEEKTISWYQAGRRYGSQEQRAIKIQYHTSLKEAEQFGELVWASGVQYRADLAKELIFVCDGAKWIWKLVSHYFPEAVQIVDWYHVCEYLSPIAETLFPSDEHQRETWMQEIKDMLWQGDVQAVIQICHHLSKRSHTAQPAKRALTYYTNNQHRMNYPLYRERGYFIGSGTVESACKQIVSMRLKRSGARWTLDGAATTVKARAAWLSDGDTWHSLTSLPLVS
jgi:hypothetical protein